MAARIFPESQIDNSSCALIQSAVARRFGKPGPVVRYAKAKGENSLIICTPDLGTQIITKDDLP
jgi:hypothetical protein